jgi:glycosyltransferase involved in cell wall biosynthesis/GT2 family glycosyltransferase
MPDEPAAARPPVSVITPFLGTASEAEAALAMLATLELGPRDEVIVADNTADGTVERVAAARPGPPAVVAARAERSAYYARNVAAEHAGNPWLLFVDADCLPAPTLADDYFAEPVAPDVGALAGPIVPAPGQAGLMPRWAASREVLSQERSMDLPAGPAAATANMLVRREAFAAVGGFLEGASLGNEFELCWRLADAGWRLEYRERPRVEHLHRETLRAVVRQFSMYAAGDAWLNRRRPGAVPRPRLLAPIARCIAGIAGFGLTGRFDRARMKAVDAVVVAAQWMGYRRGNAAPRVVPATAAPGAETPGPEHRAGIVVYTDYFPVLTEQFVTRELAALAAAGRRARVEAVARPERPLEGGARGIDAHWLEDEGTFDRFGALVALVSRHPVRVLADLRFRRRFPPGERMPLRALAPAVRRLGNGGEPHIHVHFAAMAAVNALRVARFTGATVSITPHAHEIYARGHSRGLAAKLTAADLVATVCEYNVAPLRDLVPAEQRERVVSIPLGIDVAAHSRSRPRPEGRTVVAVGRLVEQKGFRHLIAAAAELEARRPLDRVVIAGGGPLRAELADLAARRGLAARVELTGPLDPQATRGLLESADAFAMPSVIAADGNRDAIPVVVLEALALGVPVAATEVAGLPEVVRPPWGRVVEPGDVAALAGAIDELLALGPEARAEAGAAGRAFVAEHHEAARQARRLLERIDAL